MPSHEKPRNSKAFEGTTQFLEGLPPERALTMVARTRMGGALVAGGGLAVVASFTLAGIALVRGAELGAFVIAFLALLLVVGLVLVVVGATFWSTQIVGKAVGDLGQLAKSGGGIAKLFRRGGDD